MKFKHFSFIFILPVVCFLVSGCSKAERDNKDDPLSGDYSIIVSVNPPSGSAINGRDSITVTFQDPMNTGTLVVGGTMATAVTEWGATILANDTLTLSPPANGVWTVAAGQTLTLACNSSSGPAIDPLSLSYDVSYSITRTTDPTSGSSIDANGSITITFSDPMDDSSLDFTGTTLTDDLANINAVWSDTDDTLTLSPPAGKAWILGDQTLSLDCNSAYGPAIETLVVNFVVTYSITATLGTASGEYITGNEPLTVVFSEAMDTSDTSLELSGTLIGNSEANVSTSWSTDSTQLTMTPAGTLWSSAEGVSATLIINCNNASGTPMDAINPNYTVEYVVYVNGAYTGSSTIGTKDEPFKNIQLGIDEAETLYSPSASEVHVATGTYLSDYRGSTPDTPVIDMIDNISVYGGYSSNFLIRNTTSNETIIQDTSTTGGTLGDPNRTVNIDSSITNNTEINGFTIISGAASAN